MTLSSISAAYTFGKDAIVRFPTDVEDGAGGSVRRLSGQAGFPLQGMPAVSDHSISRRTLTASMVDRPTMEKVAWIRSTH